MHSDTNNVGYSVAISIGFFSGGRLWLAGDFIDTWCRPCLFDGQQDHCTEDYEGSRYAIVAYTHKSVASLSADDKTFLESCVFPLPDVNEVSLQERFQSMIGTAPDQ